MRWEIREVDEKLVEQLSRELGISRLTAKLLVLRGIYSVEDARSFYTQPNRCCVLRF